MTETEVPAAKRARFMEHFVVPETARAGRPDIVLQSTDGVRYLVHTAYLTTSCHAFSGMFETANPDGDQGSTDSASGLPVIKLEEQAQILDNFLPFCYNVRLHLMSLVHVHVY